MDHLVCASLSHIHYWYEVGMLKVPAKYILYLLFVTIKTCCALVSVLTFDLRIGLFHTPSYYFAFIKHIDRQDTIYRWYTKECRLITIILLIKSKSETR